MKRIDFEYDIDKHEQFFFDQMNERGKRLYLGLEVMKLGYNGVSEVSQKFNILGFSAIIAVFISFGF
ncbi:MAG: hypothetical protein LBK58_03295 [Prevotellaceae bacterium]|jgi:hypothetical protein|nr:hypothetical protein [Prevotellaceae bacterium]